MNRRNLFKSIVAAITGLSAVKLVSKGDNPKPIEELPTGTEGQTLGLDNYGTVAWKDDSDWYISGLSHNVGAFAFVIDPISFKTKLVKFDQK